MLVSNDNNLLIAEMASRLMSCHASWGCMKVMNRFGVPYC